MAEVETNLLQLPSEIISHILSFMSFDQISNVRLVSKTIDAISQQLLNQGFSQVDKYHNQVQKQVKAQLPRRESERRVHLLARHVDILSAIETRLSLLSMTYMKYVTSGICCFIPGKVIDEIYFVLRYLQANKSPPHSHELLRELRDISSMAMEHFDEKIAPGFKGQLKNSQQTSMSEPRPGIAYSKHLDCEVIPQRPGTSTDQLSAPLTPQLRLPSVRKEIMQLQHQMRAIASSLITSKKEATDFRKKFIEQNTKIQDQNKKIIEQNRLIGEQTAKITEQDQKIDDIAQRLVEYDNKFAENVHSGSEKNIVQENNKERRIDNKKASNVSECGSSVNVVSASKVVRKRKCDVPSATPVAKRTRARTTKQ